MCKLEFMIIKTFKELYKEHTKNPDSYVLWIHKFETNSDLSPKLTNHTNSGLTFTLN
jgi:hypothetical protein